jgi:hypothetical protein
VSIYSNELENQEKFIEEEFEAKLLKETNNNIAAFIVTYPQDLIN